MTNKVIIQVDLDAKVEKVFVNGVKVLERSYKAGAAEVVAAVLDSLGVHVSEFEQQFVTTPRDIYPDEASYVESYKLMRKGFK